MSQTKAQLISDLVQALNFTGTSSAPANGMYLSAANTIKLATNSNGRLTIDSSGNATFTGTCTATTFSGSGASLTNLPDKDQIKEGNSYAEILDTGSNGIFRFLPEGTEVFRIDKDGKVGIGTNNAGTNLHIQNTSANPQVRISSANDGICELQFGDQADTVRGNIIYRNGSAGDALCFNGYNNTERMRIASNGQVGVNQIPDASGGLFQIKNNMVYTSGTTDLLTSASKAALRIRTSSDSSKSLYFGGIDETAVPYLQVGNMSGASGGATASYDLVLNPYGGNVGIGTTSPAHKLHVVGTTKLFGTTAIGGNDDITPDANGVGQLTIDANGYTGYIAANATAMYFGHNSNSRDLTLQTNESDRLTIDGSTGNVGIGTTSPTDKLHVAGNIINTTSVSGTGDSGFQIANGHRLGFDQSGTRSWSIKATGGVLNIDSGDGNSGPRVRGLLFGSDTADANKLDDYEEGTWTPGIAFGGGTTGLSISKQTGYYVKIGRLVNLGGTLILSAKGSSTGSATLTGLPFNVGDLDTSTSAEGGGSFTYWTNMNTDKLDWTLRGSNNSSTADISVSRAGGHTQIDAAADSDFQNSSSIRFIMTYQT